MKWLEPYRNENWL